MDRDGNRRHQPCTDSNDPPPQRETGGRRSRVEQRATTRELPTGHARGRAGYRDAATLLISGRGVAATVVSAVDRVCERITPSQQAAGAATTMGLSTTR